MNERLASLLNSLQLSPSQMAETLNVQRSTFSHILKGRNKPSFDLIQKILQTYTNVNSDWLILGEGPMLKNSEADIEAISSKTQDLDLFQESRPKPNTTENTGKKALNEPIQNTEKQIVKSDSSSAHKLVEIVHIYSDGSFKHYKNS